jgi:flagellin
MSITQVNSNVSALQQDITLNNISTSMSKTMKQLSTGLKINSAADNPTLVGLGNLDQKLYNNVVDEIANAQNFAGLLSTYDSSLGTIGNMLQNVSDAAMTATDSTLSNTQRAALGQAAGAILTGIATYLKAAQFNDRSLFQSGMAMSGVFGPTLSFQTSAPKFLSIGIATIFGGVKLSVVAGANFFAGSTVGNAVSALNYVKSAIAKFANFRATIGAQAQNVQNIIASLQNTQVAEASQLSNVQDVDMASAITTYTRQQILASAATSMLAQSNMQPQSILKLLG